MCGESNGGAESGTSLANGERVTPDQSPQRESSYDCNIFDSILVLSNHVAPEQRLRSVTHVRLIDNSSLKQSSGMNASRRFGRIANEISHLQQTSQAGKKAMPPTRKL